MEPLYAIVDVELDVVDRNNKPPKWEHTTYGPIFIRENVTVGTVVTSVKARLVYQNIQIKKISVFFKIQLSSFQLYPHTFVNYIFNSSNLSWPQFPQNCQMPCTVFD